MQKKVSGPEKVREEKIGIKRGRGERRDEK